MKKLINILLLILGTHTSGCDNECKSLKGVQLEILKNEKVKFNENFEKINHLKDAFILKAEDLNLQNLKNQINCEQIKKSDNNEIIFYFKNSSYKSCALGDISFVYIYSKNDYSKIKSNLIKYYRLNDDFTLKMYLPDF